MKLVLTIIIFSFGVFIQMPAQAQDAGQGQHVLMTPYELEIQDIARKKLYPGGRDEEPLRVLSQLPQPVRKMGPATEAPEEDSASAERD